MNIVIYGANEAACLLAAKLYEDHDITIIDDSKEANDALSKLDIKYIQGAGADIKVLEAAGIKEADIFTACSSNDEANIVSCLTVNAMAYPKTVCFISKNENAEALELIRNTKLKKPSFN